LQLQNINTTSPAKAQCVTHTFSTVQQDCLTLKMEATRLSEASGTQQSATPLTEPEITQQ